MCKSKSPKMDPSEDQLQSLGICHRIFYFIMKTLTAQAIKPVTLGDPRHLKPIANPTDLCTADDQPSRSMLSKEEPEPDTESVILVEVIGFDCTNSTEGLLVEGEEARESAPGASIQKRAVRKMVSIKDEAEVIDLGKKRRKLTFEKQTSASRTEDHIGSRPLKSILRVGSSLK